MARLFSINVGGATLAKALGGRKAGGGWMARCPAHDDREPSLSIRDADDGKVLVRCHAGCDQERVIAALRSRGLWEENGHRRFTRPAPRAAASAEPDRDDAKRTEAALAIWQSAMPADGTPVETYLASRGLHRPAAADAPLPCRSEASFGRHLASDGRAGDARRGRHADRDPSHLPCPRRRRQGAGRSRRR